MPRVDVPGLGVVEFPDSMSTADIGAASSRLYQQHVGQGAGGSAAQTVSSAHPSGPMDILMKLLPPAAITGAGIGAESAINTLGKAGPRAIGPLAKLFAKQVPGVGHAIDLHEAVKSMGGPPPLQAAQPTPAPVSASSPALRSTRVEVTAELRKRFPALKHFKPGETISAAQLDKIKLAKAGVPTRPINVQGKPQAKAPAQTTEPSYTGGRGASGPELERRAAAMAQATGGRPPLSLVPQEMPQIPPAASLEDQLRQALAAEQAMGAQGLAPAERVGLRAGLRSALPPALEALTFLLGSQQVPQQMEEARRQYLQGAHPDLYRMLYENPNQSIPGGI